MRMSSIILAYMSAFLISLFPTPGCTFQVLQTFGATMEFCYDLGDCWRHQVTVERIYKPAESTGAVEVLGGAMAVRECARVWVI